MSRAFLHYGAFLFTILVLHSLVTELTTYEGDIIATLVMIGSAVLGYGTFLYVSRDRAKYPSTVRNRLRQGFEKGATKR